MDKWSLRDVVLLAFLAFLFGGVFMGADAIYAVVAAALTPLGYALFANELLFGMWVMAAPMTTMLLRKKKQFNFRRMFRCFSGDALRVVLWPSSLAFWVCSRFGQRGRLYGDTLSAL